MVESTFRDRAKGALSNDRAEDGFTLIELIVAIGVLLVFLSIFLVAFTGLMRGTAKIQTTAESATGVLTVFQSLDRQVRYAQAINTPGDGSSGATYIEFLVPAASSPLNADTCYQWRYTSASGQLAYRRWVASATPASVWTTKATGLIDDPATDYPFAMIPATALQSTKQSLGLKLKSGNSSSGSTSIATTFVARNSSSDSTTNSPATYVPVCNPTGTRS